MIFHRFPTENWLNNNFGITSKVSTYSSFVVTFKYDFLKFLVLCKFNLNLDFKIIFLMNLRD